LNTITAMSIAVSKHVTAESQCGNTVSILPCPSMAIVMGATLHRRKLASAENLGSNFNLQFNKCSNSLWIQSYYMINVPSCETQ
jgi:hypothetical protein